MPLFGFRKDKKHEQSHIQAKAVLTKAATGGKVKQSRAFKSENAAVTSPAVISKSDPKQALVVPVGTFSSATDVIIRPRVTEKSGLLSQIGIYTFQVRTDATKQSVAKAISALYKVTPVKVAVLNMPAKKVFVRGKRGVVAGMRKAVVTVRKGDKIDFV